MSHRRRELRYYLQAVNNRWDTPQSERDKAEQLAREILADATATKRERLTARLVMGCRGIAGPSALLGTCSGGRAPDSTYRNPSVR